MIINKLSEIMGRNRFKIKDVVERSELARNTVTELYYDRAKMISFETMDKLCRALNCQPGDLFEYIPTAREENQNAAQV
ncbi:MAG: helix-turn-helix domain-containing protein [Desulfurispora sp.]|uniref:helix-turn-helix domain-containing protein n=1 Tax=Desulfurispora sp. TaxID=3014275 RepID=UPI00404B4374